MSDKVKHYLIIDTIVIAVNIFITSILIHLCSYITYEVLSIIVRTVLVILSVCVDLFITFFFLLYWWSDIKWTQCKQKAKKIFNK